MIHRLEWWQLCVPLVIGASLLPPGAAGLALAGLVPVLLGAAGLAVIRFGDATYVAASTGLMLAGATIALAAAAGALRRPLPASRQSVPGALLVLVGAVAIALRAAPLLGSIGVRPVLLWGAGVTASWWALVAAGRLVRLRSAVAWLDRAVLARRPATTPGILSRAPRGAVGALVLGGLLMLLAPHVGLALAGMVVASVGAEAVFRGSRRVPVLPLITIALLPAWWLLGAVAGPLGLGTATLDQVPLSPAAARLVALPFGLVVWGWMGLWPLHGAVVPVMLAPLGAAFWLRVAEPVAAEGLAHWQPVFVALAVAGLWHAAADGRLTSVFVALALAALASLGPQSAAAAVLLLAAALAYDRARRLALAAAAAGAGLAFAAGLRAEVVLTVLAAAGLAYGFRSDAPLNVRS